MVVITGGSDGIGKAAVSELLYNGAKVATCGRNYDKLYELQTQHPNKPLLIYSADVSSESDCQNFIQLVVKTFGVIDILINNAGISMRALFEETELETLKQVMNVNFWGTVYCTRFALPHIRKQQGIIAGISSVAGHRGLPGRTAYSASKFAMNGFFEALRTELLDTGVHIMWISPGFVASNIRHAALNKEAKAISNSTMNESKLMTPEQCASAILQAIEKKKRNPILTFMGKEVVFLNKVLPAITDKMLRKFYFKKGSLVK